MKLSIRTCEELMENLDESELEILKDVLESHGWIVFKRDNH